MWENLQRIPLYYETEELKNLSVWDSQMYSLNCDFHCSEMKKKIKTDGTCCSYL